MPSAAALARLLLFLCFLGGPWGCLEADSRGENNVLNNTPGQTATTLTETCDCQNGARCDAQGTCQCEPGFYGPLCEEACQCQNTASCDDGPTGSGQCICLAGTYGTQCENTCMCQDPFLCRDGTTGDGVCLCTNGKLAPNCDTADSCECKNGGTCQGPEDACVCPAGFYGSLCQDTCECENEGVCDDGATGGGQCTCATGFWGDLCEKSCDCNGLSCNAATGQCGQQQCQPGTYGPTCEMACQCQNGAACNEGKQGDGSCTCPPGTFGATCEKTCPGGQAAPCSGHGVCDDGAAGLGTCACNAGFAGPSCAMTASCTDPGSKAGDVMIAEVMYDAPNGGAYGEPEAEYVLLYNNSCGVISTAGWQLCDGGGCETMKPLSFSPGQVITIVDSLGPEGYAAYGCTPGSLVFDKVGALASGKWFAANLSNGGDAVEIKNAAGLRLDAMSYGSNTSIFSPPLSKQAAGEAASRLGYPWSGTLPPNTGAPVWTGSPVAGHLCGVATGKAI